MRGVAACGSAMHLLQFADVEELSDVGGHGVGISAAEACEYRGAIVLYVDDILPDQHSRLHPVIDLGEVFEILAPARLEFPQLPQLALAIERHRHPWMPVLAVPEHHDAAVRMMGLGGSAFDHRE